MFIDILVRLQGIALDILVAMGVIKSHHFWLEVEQIQEAIQNVLVCLEMVIFAAVQKHAYHVGPYSGETKKKLDKKTEWSCPRLEREVYGFLFRCLGDLKLLLVMIGNKRQRDNVLRTMLIKLLHYSQVMVRKLAHNTVKSYDSGRSLAAKNIVSK